MPHLLTVLLIWLATYRITRLAVRDQFPPIAVPRARLVTWAERTGRDWLAYLAECPWCASVYIGGALTAATAAVTVVPLPVLVWAAASGVAGLLSSAEPDEPEE